MGWHVKQWQHQLLVIMLNNRNSQLLQVRIQNTVWKIVLQSLINLNTLLACNPAIAPLKTYTKFNTYVNAKTCSWMFIIAPPFITVKTWKEPRCPSVGEWINELWYILSMEYYSALKVSTKPWKNIEGSWMPIFRWKKPTWKGYILCDSNYMTYKKRKLWRH